MKSIRVFSCNFCCSEKENEGQIHWQLTYCKNKPIIFVTLTIAMTQELFARYSFLLDRTARKVKQYAQQQFKQAGFDVTVDQWLVLKNLAENPQLSQTELANLVFKDHPTLTRIIDLLHKKGHVLRVQHPQDRRSFQLHLTEAGVEKVAELRPKVLEIREKAWENLTEVDFLEFKRVLNTIYQNLDDQTNNPSFELGSL